MRKSAPLFITCLVCLLHLANYHLNGQQIPDLGLIVSGDFNWRPHYQSITSRAFKVLGLLRRVFSGSVSVSAKCSLYTSLVRSQLLYCSPVWHPYLLRDIRCLELVQRRATKFITNNPVMDYRNRLIHLKLLPLMMEYEIADIMFLVKSIKFPSDHFRFCDYFQFCSHPTRGSSNLKLKHSLCRTVKDREGVLRASLRQSTWRASSRSHYSSHTSHSMITSYSLALLYKNTTG